MMKADIKTEWLAALRSGKYQQGKRVLKTADDKFCCLGVLCDLSGVGKWSDEAHAFPSEEHGFVYQTPNGDDDGAVLPFYVEEWAGLNDVNPTIASMEFSLLGETLAALNDRGASFTEIADLIEKHL